MSNAYDVLFRPLADPTRRALFERLCREGEKTVGALTAQAGVSQPAVSRHLGVLKQAGLVRTRHEGRQTHLQRASGRLGAAGRLDNPDKRVLAEPLRRPRRLAKKDGPMNELAAKRLSPGAKTSGKTAASAKAGAERAASQLIDARIKELNDWRGETLGRVRKL